MRRPKTLRERIEGRIARKRGEDVFLTREFRDLGGEDQVLRVLRNSRARKAPRAARLRGLWPRNRLTSFRRPDPLQPERISRCRAASPHEARREMGAD